MAWGRARDARAAVLGASMAAAATVGQLVCAKAARDALFLASFDVVLLPRMMAAAAVASLLAALGSSRAMALWSPARVLRSALVANAVLYAVEWSVYQNAPQVAAITLYLQLSVFGTTLIAGLWSLVNESFDPHSAKRHVGSITMGGTLGGALGGLAAFGFGRWGGIPALFAVLTVLNLLAIPAAARVRPLPSRVPAERQRIAVRPGWAALRDVPYLRQLALVVALVAVMSTLLDYVLSAAVVAKISDSAGLVGFFAVFHMGVGLLSLVLQAVFTRPALERIGLAGTIAALPAAVFVTGALGLALPNVWTAAAARGADVLMASSLYRTGYELAYTPIARAQKRSAKMLIDVGVDRLGTGLGTGVVMLVIANATDHRRLLLVLVLAIAVVTALLAVRLHGGYVAALAASLERGSVKLSSTDVFDATTRRTLAETSALDRGKLLASIERRRISGGLESEFPPAPDAMSSVDLPEEVLPDERGAGFDAAPVSLRFGLLGIGSEDTPGAALDDLQSGDSSRVRRRLSEGELVPELVPAVIALLGTDDHSREALKALRQVGPRIVGQLVDVLLDRDRDVVVRRRVPRVLETVADPRAIAGLSDGLFDAELDVRHQCAWALQRASETSAVALPRERVFEAVRRELERAGRISSGRDGPDPAELRSLEHAILVLSLVLEREPLVLAYRALLSGDEGMRGTALEYFENVLPEDLRQAGLPLFDRLSPRGRTKRDPSTLRDELYRTRSG